MAETPSPLAATQPANPALENTAQAEPATKVDSSILRAGATAGDYRIIRRIGGGAMGDVYEGEAEAIGKRVAVKVLKNLAAESEDAAERFLREARAVNKIDHPNVLDVFAFGKLDDGRLYLVMDLLSGESLGDAIRRRGALEPDAFLDIVRPICHALDAAHRAGIVHRDLKPDNVFLAEQSDGVHVYVLDFGIAKMLSEAAAGEGHVTLTGEGVWIGTPAYMSPEQWAADPATPQSDVYALGCTAFEMLSGRVPFSAQSVPGIMQKHFNETPPALHRSVVDGDRMSVSFSEAIESALAKEPSERPNGALEFLDALEGAAPKVRHRVPNVGWLATASVVFVGALVVAMAAFFLWPRSNGQTGELGSPSGAPEVASIGDWSIELVATPAHATVRVVGPKAALKRCADTGQPSSGTGGRLTLEQLPADVPLSIEASAPGYTIDRRTLKPNKHGKQTIVLGAVKSFEGVWRLEDHNLRAFKRQGDEVHVFHLDSLEATPELLRSFPFTENQGNWIHFAGPVALRDARAPEAPSCQFDLQSEYRFHPSTARMQLRRQVAAVSFDPLERRCGVEPGHMLGWEDVERVQRASNEVRWVVSRGGSKNLQLVRDGNTWRKIRKGDGPRLSNKELKEAFRRREQQRKEQQKKKTTLKPTTNTNNNKNKNNDNKKKKKPSNNLTNKKPDSGLNGAAAGGDDNVLQDLARERDVSSNVGNDTNDVGGALNPSRSKDAPNSPAQSDKPIQQQKKKRK